MQQVGASAGKVPVSAGRHPARRKRRLKSRKTHRKSRAFAIKLMMAMTVLTGTSALVLLALPAILAHGPAKTSSAAGPVNSDGPGHLDRVIAAAGFGVDEVTLSGHHFTTDTEVFDALDLANAVTMPALNSVQVQARLRRLPWVATASMTRVYPGRVDIQITERTPFAVWTSGAKTMLVDETGRHLSTVNPSDWPNLPRIVGEGAPEEAAALYKMLSYYPAITARLQSAERITGRRWRLNLTGGSRIELPPEAGATALASLAASPAMTAYLEKPGMILDLRAPSRIAARPSGGI